jgi:hypothetical protein
MSQNTHQRAMPTSDMCLRTPRERVGELSANISPCLPCAVHNEPYTTAPSRTHAAFMIELIATNDEDMQRELYKQGLTLKDIAQEQRDKIESDMRPHEHVRVFECASIERRHLHKGRLGVTQNVKVRTYSDRSQQPDSSNQGNTRRNDKCLRG